jgi:hypothetical protein
MSELSASILRQAIVLNRDLMFGSRIRRALNGLGLSATFVKDSDQFVAALERAADAATIGIIDMNEPVDWTSVASWLAESGHATPILAFGPHVDAAGRRAAKAAGVTRIVSNGQFHEGMTELIERYRAH